MRVNERIRRYIEEKGLKRNFVAEQAKIPVKRFYRLLDGTSPLTADEYEQICSGLSVPPAYFFSYEFLESKNTQAASSA